MGYPMARNLIQAGHELCLWSNTRAKAEKLAAEFGGTVCETPAEVAAQVECLFLCVGDTLMSEEVLLGENGVIDGAKPGLVVVDASTVAPSSSKAVHGELLEYGVSFLGAPCTGSKPGAESGNLTFMIGGEESVFEKVREYFLPMGKRLYYCGGPGMGLHAKLTQNLILANVMQAFNEGIVLATKAGVDAAQMLDILANSAARTGLVEFKAPYVLRRDFDANFSLKWMHKDVGLMLESAQELDVPLPITALTRQMFQAGISSGFGEEDFCSSIKVMEQWAGVEVKAN